MLITEGVWARVAALKLDYGAWRAASKSKTGWRHKLISSTLRYNIPQYTQYTSGQRQIHQWKFVTRRQLRYATRHYLSFQVTQVQVNSSFQFSLWGRNAVLLILCLQLTAVRPDKCAHLWMEVHVTIKLNPVFFSIYFIKITINYVRF